MDGSFPMRCYMQSFKISGDLWACCQPLPMQQILPNQPKTAKICPKPKLWNTTKNWDFSFFQKYKFLHVEAALEHVSTVWIFNPRIFHMLFLLSKNGLCMWISAYPLLEIDDFLKVPHLVWSWDFVDMYLTHLGIRIWRGSFHIYLRKWFFWTSKDCCSSRRGAKKTFSSTLNVMILQTVRNESVRFGGHIDIEVSYKILWLEIPKLVLILRYLACFQKGLFVGNFEHKHTWSFRG
jgi:hypothetical protein